MESTWAGAARGGWRRVLAVVAVVGASACNSGGFICEGGCPDGSVCEDDRCVAPDASCEHVRCREGYVCEDGICVVCEDGTCVQQDPCEDLLCGPGQVCRNGVCMTGDPCEGVVCPNPGEVCSGGVCVAGEADVDGDGVLARDDCDDGNASVHPGAPEVCNGVDDDCDAATADGAAECAGFCCGSPASCRACCTADQCGTGSWACDGFACGCAGLVYGSACLLDPECTPEETSSDAQGCGWCGTQRRSRTCGGDGNWGAWGAWGACTGEGVCSPGASDGDSRSCGACGGGTQSRSATCTSSCEWSWGGWSACSGDRACTDAFGNPVCPGDTGYRPCPSHPEGLQTCTCSSYGTWSSCIAGCML